MSSAVWLIDRTLVPRWVRPPRSPSRSCVFAPRVRCLTFLSWRRALGAPIVCKYELYIPATLLLKVSESEGTQQVLKVRRHVPQSIASRPARTSRAVATSRTRASRCRRRRCVSLARDGPSSRRSARAPGPRRGISPASSHRRRRPPPAHTARRSLKCAATALGRRRPPPRRRAASRVPSAPVP